jgi:3(or 17)beta-hydroxysteroid dehydrogenase
MGRLTGKVAIVTGAASGLGRADCEAMVREGAKVMVTDVNEAGAAAVAAALNAASPGSAASMAHDVRDEARWAEVVAATVQTFGKLNVLVNNAGVVIVATPETTTLEQFRFANAVMCEGVFLGCKTAIPAMREAGGGSIINMSSIATYLGYPVFFAYTAAKGAVAGMTKSIAIHCQMNKMNIRCNSVHPGAIDTAMVDNASQQLGIGREFYTESPWGLGKPEDVANLVVFLASDESRFINGTEQVVDNALSIQ